MQIIYKNQTKKFKHSEHCVVIEYPLVDKDINGAVAEITGRYPEKGRIVNLKCKELAYVINGSGKVVVENKEVNIKEGDLVLIEPGERYFWDGHFTIFLSCTPAWYPDQYKNVE